MATPPEPADKTSERLPDTDLPWTEKQLGGGLWMFESRGTLPSYTLVVMHQPNGCWAVSGHARAHLLMDREAAFALARERIGALMAESTERALT